MKTSSSKPEKSKKEYTKEELFQAISEIRSSSSTLNIKKQKLNNLLPYEQYKLNDNDFTTLASKYMYSEMLSNECNKMLHSINLIKFLLTNPKIDINVANEKGESPIMRAYRRKYSDIVNALINNPKLKINHRDRSRKTILYIAAIEKNDVKMVQTLLKRPDIELNEEASNAKRCLDELNREIDCINFNITYKIKFSKDNEKFERLKEIKELIEKAVESKQQISPTFKDTPSSSSNVAIIMGILASVNAYSCLS